MHMCTSVVYHSSSVLKCAVHTVYIHWTLNYLSSNPTSTVDATAYVGHSATSGHAGILVLVH